MNHVFRSPGFGVGVVLLSGVAPIAVLARIPLVGVPGQQCMSAGCQGTGGAIAAKQSSQAVALLDRARADGHLEGASEYTLPARLYVRLGLSGSDATADASKAVAILQECLRTRIIQRGLASCKLPGDCHAHAVDPYTRASPDSKTGVADFKRSAASAAYQQAEKDPAAGAEARSALKQLRQQ